MRFSRTLLPAIVLAALLLMAAGGAAAQTRIEPPNEAGILDVSDNPFDEVVFLPITTQLTGFDISGFTIETDEPEHSCYPGAPSTGSNSAWVYFSVPNGATVNISTAGSTADTVMTLHSGFTYDFIGLTEVACGTSSIGELLTAGMYHLQISKSGGADLLDLSIIYTPPAGSSAPSNDDLADAKSIKLGKTYTANGVEFATVEVDEPKSGCGQGHPTATVWYTFDIPEGFDGYVNFTSLGSYTAQADTYYVNDVILTIYDSNLDEVNCNDDFGGTGGGSGVLGINFNSGDEGTYYVAVGAYTNTNLIGPSFYKLATNVTVLYMNEWPLVDGDFEDGSTEWQFAKANNGDAIVNDPDFADSGDYYAMFAGGADEATKLSQTFDWPSVILPQVGGQIALAVNYSSTTANGKLKVKLVVSHKNGTTSVGKSTITGRTEADGATTADYLFTPYVSAVLTNKKVESVKVQFKNKSSDGTVRIDALTMVYFSATLRDANGLLPVPSAP